MSDVPTSTLRFYERAGLLRPVGRSRANYRAYSLGSAERLKFIRSAQSSGFSLKDIRQMLAMAASDAPPCKEVADLISHRLAEVKRQVVELKRVERVLSRALKSCCRGGQDWCREIERLKGRSSCDCPPGKAMCC